MAISQILAPPGWGEYDAGLMPLVASVRAVFIKLKRGDFRLEAHGNPVPPDV